MKKLIVTVLLVGFMFGIANAYSLKLESLTVGSFYDFNRDDLLIGGFTSMFDLAKIVSVDIGLVTDLDSVALMSGASLDLQNAVNGLATITKLPFHFNLPESLNIGVYGARNFSVKKWLWGVFGGLRF